MRKLAVLALLALAACDRRFPTAPARSLRITALVTPAVFQAGQTVAVQIDVANEGSEAQLVSVYQGDCGLAFTVLDKNGTDTHVGQQITCTAAASDAASVAPGSWYTVTQQWSTRDLPLPAGTYTVRSALTGSGVVNVPVTIQITP